MKTAFSDACGVATLLSAYAASVNSMLIRLEQRGFVRHIPGVARTIELTIDDALIPKLDGRFRA